MEIKVKPKATESTIVAAKEEDVTNMKACVLVGQKAEEEINTKGQESMKIMEGLRQNSDETKQDDSKSDSGSSSSSSSSLEIMKNLEIESTKEKEENKKENNNISNKKTSSHVWDCGSSLYDSFELNSFKRQLDSAISASSARTMSMSHLPDRRLPPLDSLSPKSYPPPATTSSSVAKKHSNKISRSLQRFLKSVFRPKQHQSLSSSSTPSSPVYKAAGHRGGDKDRYYVVYDKSGSLTTIPESTEREVGPEISSLVRKTVSERFPANRVVGISCA
ncbi:unnamed protein product [Microthlaspi erraticum]|uniref:Uncharacterized protein n=1 Tax=Microthlaspi erraticum TaxID=1685480 RepID=A0A6D2IK13_9BRAS|nr:unnamed protein product [Microthlaspi erraticum]